MSDTLNSPQGDGNGGRGDLDFSLKKRQTPSIPRKGTETQNYRKFLTGTKKIKLLLGQTPSIPRKGTETVREY